MKDEPIIKFNYMSHEDDWKEMRSAIEVARQVMRQPSMVEIAGDEIMPGKDADLDSENHNLTICFWIDIMSYILTHFYRIHS